jgi:beta-xylosidase
VAQPIWFQIQDDGADRVFRISMNGVHWHDVNSVVNSDFLSSRSQYGFYVSSRAGTTRAAMSLMSLIVE